jgi:glutaminyl-peptide cyclotransferase
MLFFVSEFNLFLSGFSLCVNKLKHLLTYLNTIALTLGLLASCASCNNLVQPTLYDHKTKDPQQLVAKVLAVMPHDRNSFTEGLLWYDGYLYESSGLYGKSNLRKIDPQTGKVLQRVEDPVSVFGEGLALDGRRLYQLTWHENMGFVYDLDTLTQVGTFAYDGEGWGLCFDGWYFWMSNGTAFIYKREPKTFAILGSVQVVQNGTPISQLNELECVGDSIYANIWKTNNILRINKATGKVTGVIDASGLLTSQELAEAGLEGVLNGIAYDPIHDTFLITGKLWPKLFEVQFVSRNSK